MKDRGREISAANAAGKRGRSPLPGLLWKAAIRCAVLACGVALSGPGRAQLPPPGPLPTPTVKVPEIPLKIPEPIIVTPRSLGLALPHPTEQRASAHLDRLRRHADRLDIDLNGNLIVRGEIVAYLPSSTMLDSVRAHGYVVLRETGAEPRIAVLKPPGNTSALAGLRRLRELFPDGVFDLNHIYGNSGEAGPGSTPRRAAVTSATATRTVRKIGLIDGGVDGGTDALRLVRIHRQGCGGRTIASAHGTAVASIMVGRGGHFSGAAPGLELYAADVYCDEPTGGSADAIVAAFVWMAGQRVPVINVSLVGPPNGVLERVVRGVIERGHHVVAAVGNDGPASPPLYPAAYTGVIGVTAVDRSLRVLPEASRGTHVQFAAPGANMAAAGVPEGYTEVRGTSFAAPVVAGLLALLVDDVGPMAARQALMRLVRMASDIGPPGKDSIYGHGLVGWNIRVDPAKVNLTNASRNPLPR